jgi:hypothetical protein
MRAVKYKMSQSSGRVASLLTYLLIKGSTVSQASKSTRSCVCALSSQSSNRTGAITLLTPFVIIGYRDTVGHRRLTRTTEIQNQQLGRRDLTTSIQKTQSGPS